MAEYDVDVLVAGAGAAGCATAMSVAEHGLSVLLIDKSTAFRSSSNTAMSTSMIPAAGSRWQQAAGIDDSPAVFHADIMRKTGGTADPVLAEVLTSRSADLVEWLVDRWGVPLELVTDFDYPGHSRRRCHAVSDRSGQTLLRHLVDAVASCPTVELVAPMELDDVLRDDDGRVAEALVRRPDGTIDRIRVPNVVLCTNGFAADPTLVARHIPEISGALYHGSAESTGDALRIGARLGADTAYLDAYQGHGSVAIPDRILLTWAAIMHGGFMVNGSGVRFGDETVGYSEFGALVNAQPDREARVVFDRRIHDRLLPFRDYQDILEAGAVDWVDDVATLSDTLGCSTDQLDQTFAEVAGAVGGERPDDFGRRTWGEVLEPPFAVVRVGGALFHTQGGLRVDSAARVLSAGEPVAGLYAAGGAAQSISGHGSGGYLAGNGLLPALALGWLAGRDIAGVAG